MLINTELKNSILESESERYCEIYKITNKINNKIYIGQAVSHILNHKKYRPYGMEKRFKCHVSEALSKKKNQCHYLNNAIRKYGKENFVLDLIKTCELKDSDSIEQEEIKINNSLYPNGYNLNTGGMSSQHTEESRKRVSDGVINYFKDKKFERFLSITNIDEDNIEKYIRPLNRFKNQYGWYVYIEGKKADFGGVLIDLKESKNMAINFIYELKNRLTAKHLDAGSS